jgi:hypothetical protein
MRKILLLISGLTLCSLANGAQWVELKNYKHSNKFNNPSSISYYDNETIKREGNFVTVWTKTLNFGNSEKDTYLMKRIFHCNNQRYQVLYVKQTGQDSFIGDYNENPQWWTISLDDESALSAAKIFCQLFGLKP